MKEKKLRRKIAKQVENKMVYMGACPNEQNIILNIILPKEDRIPWKLHCPGCSHTSCASYKDYNE